MASLIGSLSILSQYIRNVVCDVDFYYARGKHTAKITATSKKS